MRFDEQSAIIYSVLLGEIRMRKNWMINIPRVWRLENMECIKELIYSLSDLSDLSDDLKGVHRNTLTSQKEIV